MKKPTLTLTNAKNRVEALRHKNDVEYCSPCNGEIARFVTSVKELNKSVLSKPGQYAVTIQQDKLTGDMVAEVGVISTK